MSTIIRHLPTLFLLIYLLILPGCQLLYQDEDCGDNQLLGTLLLSSTLLNYLPQEINSEQVYVNGDGIEQTIDIEINSGDRVIQSDMICSNARNHTSYKYYDSEFKQFEFTFDRERFIVELAYIGENENYRHKPYEALVLSRPEDEYGSRRLLIIPDVEAALLHDEVYLNFYEELVLEGRTFTKVYESTDEKNKKFYFSVGHGVIAFEQSNVLWLIKES